MVMSSITTANQCVDADQISRPPNPPAAIACAIWSRAIALGVRRYRILEVENETIAGRLRAFSTPVRRSRHEHRLRRGRIMVLFFGS